MPLLLVREARPVKKPAKHDDDGGTVSDDKPTDTSSPDTASPALSSSTKTTAAPSTTSTKSSREVAADEKDVKYFWKKTEVSPVSLPPDFDPAKKYFKIRFTNEYFDRYEAYSERIDLYRQVRYSWLYSVLDFELLCGNSNFSPNFPPCRCSPSCCKYRMGGCDSVYESRHALPDLILYPNSLLMGRGGTMGRYAPKT